MKCTKPSVLALIAAIAALGISPIQAAPQEKPTTYHLYLRIGTAKGADADAEKKRQDSISEKLEASLSKDAPKDLLKGKETKDVPGLTVIRWTIKAWTPSQAAAKVETAKAQFKPEDNVKIVLEKEDIKTVELVDSKALSEALNTDAGALEEYFKATLGHKLPIGLITSENGGTFFDIAALKEKSGLSAAAILFDADGTPRDPKVINEQMRLARAKPRAQSTVDSRTKEPPPPLKHDGFVTAASDDAETQDILRGLIYASRGYGKGFGKGSGLYGPMGLSRATFKWAQKEASAEEKKILEKGINDDKANILAGAIIFDRLKSQFGGNTNRAVAAFHVGAGNVRKSGGIPANAKHYLGRFQLAHQQGVRRAIDPLSPRTVRKVKPEIPVSPIDAIVRRAKEEASVVLRGEPPTGRRSSFKNVPESLVRDIRKEATTGNWQTNPNALIALSEAEGGVNAGTSHADARGVLQITPETAKWECGLSRAELQDRKKNIACAEKVFKKRLDRVDGDIVLAWALYNTKTKWHAVMIREKRVAHIKETVRHVTRAAYRYYQLTGDKSFDPGTRAFREKYFTSRQALAWSAKSYQDLQNWDRGEGFKGDGVRRYAEKVPALEGSTVAGATSAPGRWKRNSSGTHWYRSSRKSGQRWDIYPYQKNGRVTTPPA